MLNFLIPTIVLHLQIRYLIMIYMCLLVVKPILDSDCEIQSQQQYDEKNIRRRVYDALNVLMAMDIISKDKKDIQWKGLPRTSLDDIEELKVSVLCSFYHPSLIPRPVYHVKARLIFYSCESNLSW